MDVSMYVCMDVCMYVCVYVCIYVCGGRLSVLYPAGLQSESQKSRFLLGCKFMYICIPMPKGRVNYLFIFLPRCQHTIYTLQWCLCNPCWLPSNYQVCWVGFNTSGSRTDVWCCHPSVFPVSLICCGLASPQLSTRYLHEEPCKCRGLAGVSATNCLGLFCWLASK